MLVRIADYLVRADPHLDATADADLAYRAGGIAMSQGAWHQACRLLSAAAHGGGDAMPPADSAGRYLDAGLAAYFDHDVEQCESHLSRRSPGPARLATQTWSSRRQPCWCEPAGRPLRPGDKPDVAELNDALLRYGDGPLSVEGDAVRAEALRLERDGSGPAHRGLGPTPARYARSRPVGCAASSSPRASTCCPRSTSRAPTAAFAEASLML